jgi:hypothetical protein
MTRKTFEERWAEQRQVLLKQAEALPFGKERDDLLRKAGQLETALHVNEWLSSPGLQSPT